MLKYFLFTAVFLCTFQTAAQDFPRRMQDAAYVATLKAVLDYKMEDEQLLEDLQKLRENEKFNAALEKKLQKLTNSRHKNLKNRHVYQMLINAGKNIYNELD